MFVNDSVQGQRGGDALFEDMAALARSLGMAAIRIVSHPPAEGFYRRMGAVRVGTQLPHGRITWARPVLSLALR
jgi:predicted N-acetyltransferase YhbS